MPSFEIITLMFPKGIDNFESAGSDGRNNTADKAHND